MADSEDDKQDNDRNLQHDYYVVGDGAFPNTQVQNPGNQQGY